jgi:hypothetical protein
MDRQIYRKRSKADLVAIALRGAWRTTPPRLELTTEELQVIAPNILRSGSAALVWWKARASDSDPGEPFKELHLAYKFHTLRAAVHALGVKEVFATLNNANIDALLVKGWAIARRYPSPGLRSYGDLDICVRTKQFESAKKLLAEAKLRVNVDLHKGFGKLDHLSEDELFERAISIDEGDVLVRVPSDEDHLRMLCWHLLRHGGSRPVWLCDVALMVETAGRDFAWQRFYSSNARCRERLGCVVGLARELLSADTRHAGEESMRVPQWLIRSVKHRWSCWFNSDYRSQVISSLLHHRFEPGRAIEDLYFRFDPLRATVEMNGRFNQMPRLPYQIGALLRRLPEASTQVARFWSGRSHLNC